MRNRFNGSRRGRRPASFGSVPGDSSPYDFTPGDEDSVDPVDLLAIRADDELLDALASGLPSFAGSEGRHALGVGHGLDDNINDDQHMLALLSAWRDEIRDAPIPELISVDEASEAIVAGYRTEQPRRRLMSVAAAAAAVVVGMSAVALGAGSAKPGDALWGVSKALNSDRASSVEAEQRVSVTLASVRQALAEGKVSEAQAKLATIAPELNKVTDEQAKDELADTQANLARTVEDAKEGEKVKTDESGKRDDGHDSDHRGGSNGHDPRPDGSTSDPTRGQPNPDDPRTQTLRSQDPRSSSGRPEDSRPDGSNSSGTAGNGQGPGHHGPGTGPGTSPETTSSQSDPSKADAPESKPTTKPQSGPKPSRSNPPPHKPTTGADNGGNGGGGNGGGGNSGGGNGGNSGGGNGGQSQNKPDGQHKAEGEGAPVQGPDVQNQQSLPGLVPAGS